MHTEGSGSLAKVVDIKGVRLVVEKYEEEATI